MLAEAADGALHSQVTLMPLLGGTEAAACVRLRAYLAVEQNTTPEEVEKARRRLLLDASAIAARGGV